MGCGTAAGIGWGSGKTGLCGRGPFRSTARTGTRSERFNERTILGSCASTTGGGVETDAGVGEILVLAASTTSWGAGAFPTSGSEITGAGRDRATGADSATGASVAGIPPIPRDSRSFAISSAVFLRCGKLMDFLVRRCGPHPCRPPLLTRPIHDPIVSCRERCQRNRAEWAFRDDRGQ